MGDNMIAKKRAEREATAAESGGRETEIDSAVIPILIATDRTRYLRGLKSIQRSD
jgi:hypothetical protein